MSTDRIRRALLSATFALAAVALARAQTTYYVNRDCGNDAWTGQSPVCQAPDGPKATIQAGVGVAFFGDTVLVADGTYTGAGNKDLAIGNGVALRSQNGPTHCIIDCQGSGRGFTFPGGEGPDTLVDGFTVTNGRASAGGAFFCYYNSAPRIANCVITGNTDTGQGGGGIYATVAAPAITNCVIVGNRAGFPGGGGIYSLFSTPVITNCTIVGNTTTASGGAVHASATSSPTITNSILWDNGATAIYADSGSTVAVSYSDVQGGWPGAGNVDADPLFLDAGGGNYRLLFGSACIDVGENAAVPPEIVTDIDNNPRFVAGMGLAPIVDLGAFESQDSLLRLPLPFSGTVRPARRGFVTIR